MPLMLPNDSTFKQFKLVFKYYIGLNIHKQDTRQCKNISFTMYCIVLTCFMYYILTILFVNLLYSTALYCIAFKFIVR